MLRVSSTVIAFGIGLKILALTQIGLELCAQSPKKWTLSSLVFMTGLVMGLNLNIVIFFLYLSLQY